MTTALPKKLFDREPPNAPSAEMSVLGSMILDPGCIGEVCEIVTSPSAFYTEAHMTIFSGIVEIYNRVSTVDLVQLADWLDRRAVTGLVGGPQYLVTLAEGVPSAINAKHYAKIVAEKYKLRQMIDAAATILHDCYNDTDEADAVLDRAESAVFHIVKKSQKNEAELLSVLLDRELERLASGEGNNGVKTGYFDIDDKTQGFQPGELTIIAARPSMGKSALVFCMTKHIAVDLSMPVALFSMEMGKESVARRFLSAASGVSGDQMRGGIKDDKLMKDIARGAQALMSGQIIIDDTPNMALMQLRGRARRMVMQHGVKVIVIDYLQLMSASVSRNDGRLQEVSAISRGLKSLARELGVPVVCLSQLNRASEQREGNRPRMADLRESGSIEQDADVIMLLHREEYYHLQDPDWREANADKLGVAEVIIAKQRNGPTGVAKLTWDSDTMRFLNRAAEHYMAEVQEAAKW